MFNNLLNLTVSAVLCLFLSSCCTNQKCSSGDVELAVNSEDLELSSGNIGDPSNINFAAEAGNRVFFGYDSQDLSEGAQEILSRQVEWLLKNPHKIVVEGYCDDRGTSEYNIGLGNRRANSVKEFLISKGVPAEYIEVISFGKDKPIEVSGSLEEVRRQNRVCIIVLNDSVVYQNSTDDADHTEE